MRFQIDQKVNLLLKIFALAQKSGVFHHLLQLEKKEKLLKRDISFEYFF